MRIPATEAERLKTFPQKSDFYLFVQSGEYLWSGRIDQIGAEGNVGIKLKVTTLSGDKTRILPNMSVWLGTAVNPRLKGHVRLIAGGDDFGTQFIVVAPNFAGLAVGDIVSVDGVPRLYAINTYHDFGDIYSSSTDSPPYVNMGPHRAVWTGEPAYFWANQTFAQRGKTIDSYTWVFGPGAFVTYPQNNASLPGTPNEPIAVRWQTPGDYYVQQQAIDSNGQSHYAWRLVMVRDRPHRVESELTPYTKFSVGSVSGDYDSGGWTADIEVLEQADKTLFPDNAVVILKADDYYDDQALSVGGLRHHEDYLFVGYIKNSATGMTGEDNQSVQISCATIHEFAKELTVWPANFAPSSSSNTHHNINQVTVGEIIVHVLQEHSTFSTHNDLLMYGMGRRVDYLDLTEGKLWDQIGEQVASTAMAFPNCNRYGQLYIHKDANHRPGWHRAIYGPPEFTFSKEHWSNIDLGENRIREVVAQVDATGVYICTLNGASATNISSVFSLWPPLQASFGEIDKLDGVLINQQTEALALAEITEWAQLRFARANIDFPRVTIETFNIRAFDPSEQNYVGVTLALEDTLEGWVWNTKEFIVRQCEYEINVEDGWMRVRYGLEDSIWGNEGRAGEYPPGATGPDYTPVITGPNYDQRTGQSVIAAWKHGVVQCENIFAAVPNWANKTGNLPYAPNGAVPTSPRLNGVERDPYDPSNRWWAYGHRGIHKTINAGISWEWIFSSGTFKYWANQAGIEVSADELVSFAVIRHLSGYEPRGFHAALVVTRYSGQLGRSKLWYLATLNDWDSIVAFKLITNWLYNPGEYSAPNLAHMDFHQWPSLQPSGYHIGWIATAFAESATVQLWRTIDGGGTWDRVVQGNSLGYEGTYPDRIIVPTAGNDDGSVAWWVGSAQKGSDNTWIKLTDAADPQVADIVITRQFTLSVNGPTFGCGFDPPFAVYPQAPEAFHSVGSYAQGACWEKRGEDFPWRQMTAPPGPYQGFTQWPYDFDIMYIGTNGPFVNNKGMIYVTRSGGADWQDVSSNLYQIITYDGITPASTQLWNICPDPMV